MHNYSNVGAENLAIESLAFSDHKFTSALTSNSCDICYHLHAWKGKLKYSLNGNICVRSPEASAR